MAAYNTSLGRFQLTDVAPAPKGVPQIEVAFEIDVNGIVKVSALDQATGREQNITVRAASGLSETEVHRLRQETEALELAERSDKERDRVAGQLQGLIGSTQKTYDLLSSKLTEDERAQANEALGDARKAKEGTLEGLKAALARLEATAETLGQAMLRG
jgi:molecular chaperone DnaK